MSICDLVKVLHKWYWKKKGTKHIMKSLGGEGGGGGVQNKFLMFKPTNS